jgi:hypothetical protein
MMSNDTKRDELVAAAGRACDALDKANDALDIARMERVKATAAWDRVFASWDKAAVALNTYDREHEKGE